MEYIEYIYKKSNLILLRMYGKGSIVEVPAQINGKKITKLADHIFALEPSSLFDDDKMLRAVLHGKDYVSTGDKLPGEEPLCSETIEVVRIPEGVEEIGNYGFCGCYNLREIEFPSTLKRIGTGIFNGCQNLSRLTFALSEETMEIMLRYEQERSSEKTPINKQTLSIKKTQADNPESKSKTSPHICGPSVSERYSFIYEPPASERYSSIYSEQYAASTPPIMQEVLCAVPLELDAIVTRRGNEIWRLHFPEYYEEGRENTPARIIQIIYHGTGRQYRNCFLNRQIQFDKYDEIFPLSQAQESPQTNIALAMNRLRSGPPPCENCRKRYIDYLRSVWDQTVDIILEQKEFSPVSELELLNKAGFFTLTLIDAFINRSSKARQSDAVSCLMNIKRRSFPSEKKHKYTL